MTQKTRAALETEISTLLADNGTGAITAGILRTVVDDLCDSAVITLTDAITPYTFAGVVLSNGTALTTDSTTAHTAKLQAYDVDGAAYSTFATLTNGNTPTLDISAPVGGGVTIDGAVIGGVTPAAAAVTALTATTVNKVTVTAPASSAVLTIADGKTLTVSNTLTLAGTNSTTMTFPTTSATIARTDAANTFTGTQTVGALVASGVTQAAVAVGSSIAASATNAGTTYLLNTAGGSTLTLPAATGTGNVYKVVVTVSTTSAAHKVLAASGSDFIIGCAVGQSNAGAVLGFHSAAATNHSLQMPNAGSQPSGGITGDSYTFTDVATNLWVCSGMFTAGTTATTPFNSATS